jgi:hypothetical protein
MKAIKNFKVASVLLILAGGLASCKEEKGDEFVPYAVCDYEGNYITAIDVAGNAYLFNDSIPKAIEEELQQEGYKSFAAWIVYVLKDNSTTMKVISKLESKYEHSTSVICNYPDFAKQWEIPLNGQKVYYEGTAFETGRYLYPLDIVGYKYGVNNSKKTIIQYHYEYYF